MVLFNCALTQRAQDTAKLYTSGVVCVYVLMYVWCDGQHCSLMNAVNLSLCCVHTC